MKYFKSAIEGDGSIQNPVRPVVSNLLSGFTWAAQIIGTDAYVAVEADATTYAAVLAVATELTAAEVTAALQAQDPTADASHLSVG